MNSAVEITPGSGNVFADLGVADPEEMFAKAKLVISLTRVLRRRQLSNTDAAEALEISVNELQAILRGVVRRITVERLRTLLIRAKQQDGVEWRRYKQRGWHLLHVKRTRRNSEVKRGGVLASAS